MQVQVGDEVYHVHIHHNYLDEEEQKKVSWRIITTAQVHTGTCLISAGEQKFCVSGEVGTSRCSKKDVFIKRVGAKAALKDALNHTLLGKEVRDAIWQEFWKNMRRPKEKLESFRQRRRPHVQLHRHGTDTAAQASAS